MMITLNMKNSILEVDVMKHRKRVIQLIWRLNDQFVSMYIK